MDKLYVGHIVGMIKKIDYVFILFLGWIGFCVTAAFIYAGSSYGLEGKFSSDFLGGFLTLFLGGWLLVEWWVKREQKRQLKNQGFFDRREMKRRIDKAFTMLDSSIGKQESHD